MTIGIDQCAQRFEVGREVDVHVREDASIARHPRSTERAAASLLRKMDEPHTVERRSELGADRTGGVSARVVDDGDPRRKRRCGCGRYACSVRTLVLQVALLVVHGDRDVQDGAAVPNASRT